MSNNAHYKHHWWFGSASPLDIMVGRYFQETSAFKYLYRFRYKGSAEQDLEKAIDFLQKENQAIEQNPLISKLNVFRASRRAVADRSIENALKEYRKSFSESPANDQWGEVEADEISAMVAIFWKDYERALYHAKRIQRGITQGD